VAKIKYFTFLLVFIYSFSFSNELDYGLDFSHRQEVFPAKPTYLDLTILPNLSPLDKFSLKFDIIIHNKNHYGIIFSANGADEDDNLILVYKPDLKGDSAQLIMSQNFEETIMDLTVKKDDLSKWSSLDISLNFETDSIIVKFLTSEESTRIQPFEKRSNLKLLFGASLNKVDPANMAIKDIYITDESIPKAVYHWPINEIEGDIVEDNIGNQYGHIYNGFLRSRGYYYPQKITGIKLQNDYLICDPVLDDIKNIIYLFSTNFIYEVSYNGTITNKIKHNAPNLNHPEWNIPTYDPYQKQIIGINQGHGQVSIFDQNNNSWSVIDQKKLSGQYYTSSLFVNRSDGALYSLGGYGYYSVKKELLKYSYQKQEWDTVAIAGNENFYPRISALITPADSGNTFFIFGGYGNKSGKQDNDYRPLNDLWLLNVGKNIISLIDTISIPQRYITGKGFYNRLDSSLYFGCYLNGYAAGDSVTTKHFKYNIPNKTLEVLNIGNGFAQNLYYLPSKSMAYAIKQTKQDDNEIVELYRFKLPFKGKMETDSSAKFTIIIIIIGLITLLLIIVSILMKNKRKLIDNSTKDRLPLKISLFGTFSIQTSNQDFLVKVSPQTKELLVYFIIKSFINNNKVTTELFTTTFWPDHDKKSSKNARSSAVSRIRRSLTEIDGMELKVTKKIWKIEISEEIVFDFRDIISVKESLLKTDDIDLESVKHLILIIKKGLPCESLNYDWLDPIKLSIQNDVEKFCFDLIIKLLERNILNFAEELSSAIFSWNPLNEKNLSLLLRILNQQKRIGEVNKYYDLFRKEYFKLFEKEYSGSILTILSLVKN
jgi:two-component SAPR family response regulator